MTMCISNLIVQIIIANGLEQCVELQAPTS